MNQQQYQNYYKDYRNDLTTVNNSLVFRIKRSILEGYNTASENFKRNMRRSGNRRFSNKLLDKRIPRAYKRAAKAPVDENKVVFVEIRHPQLTNSFEVVFDELVNHYDYTIHTHFLLNSNTIRSDYAKRCINAAEDIATAKYVFLNEGSNALSAIPMRPETKVIQLWHGCGAFKKFGFSTADLIFGATRKEQLKHPFNKNYSLVTVSSPEVVWAYKEAMNLPEDSEIVQPTGSSRTDIFFDEEFISAAYRHLYDVIPQAKGKKVILYAPTFRGRVARATTPDMLNVKMFYENLGDEYVLLFKHHPLVKHPPVIADEFKDFAMDVGSVLSIEELLSVSDICISDYSSLVFEYSLFEKPLIFFAYDLDEYFDWRGFYYDYYELAPGLIAKTNFEMIDYIKHIDTRFDKKAVQDFRYKFMRSCDGHATERILQYAFEDLDKHKKECSHFEHFYMVPQVQSSSFPYYKRIEAMKAQKEAAGALYAEAAKAEIDSKSIVAFDIRSKELRHILKKTKNRHLSFAGSGEALEDVVHTIAKAAYILIDQPNTLLDSLALREETKVIYLPDNAFPLETFGKASKEYRSGLRKEQYALAPLYQSVSAVVCSSNETADVFRGAFGENADFITTGDVKTDIFFDKSYKKEALAKLYELYPKLEGRKIIAYITKDEETIDESSIYEYLYKDYVLLKNHINPTFGTAEEEEESYYSDSIVDVSGVFGIYETLAVSDIVIGDFNAAVYSFMASGKPVIIYCKEEAQKLLETESFIEVAENSPTPIETDIMEVIHTILDIDNYDFTKYNELKQKYLNACDGSSVKRLFQALK